MMHTQALGDWINLSGAESAPNIVEIHIDDDHVRVDIEIFVNDIVTFDRLIPDEYFKGTDIKRSALSERMKKFADEDFQIIDHKDQKLQAVLNLIEPRFRRDRPSLYAGKLNPFTGRMIPGPPQDKRVLYAELVYAFKDRPKSLTIIPPLDYKGFPAASIGFIAYHKDVPVVDFRYLSDAAKVNLDWDDPWYSGFENKSLKRWQQSGLMTYLYVEPYEVRHETLVRVKDLEQWMDLGLRGDEFIEVNEVEPLKKQVGAFFLKHSNVLIDGKRHKPILDRTSFVKYTMTRTFFLEKPERMLLSTAMMGVIITYLTEQIPQKVTVDWDLFSDKIQKVPTTAVDPAGPFPSYVTPDDNLLVWNNFLKTYKTPTVAQVAVDDALTKMGIPAVSVLMLFLLFPLAWQTRKYKKNSRPIRLFLIIMGLLIIGAVISTPFFHVSVARPSVMAPHVGDDAAVVILEDLLKNIYRSFDFREEEDVYDRLATSVNGDLLTEIYLQNRKSMVVTQAGGARARVQEIAIQDVSVTNLADRPLALLFRSKWTAKGSVGHWGHIHTRKNQYEANITVEPVDGAWKITGLELLEEKRIDPAAK